MPDIKTQGAEHLADFLRHHWERCGQFQHLTEEPVSLEKCEGKAFAGLYVVTLVFEPIARPT